jgi:hypothetical protein
MVEAGKPQVVGHKNEASATSQADGTQLIGQGVVLQGSVFNKGGQTIPPYCESCETEREKD